MSLRPVVAVAAVALALAGVFALATVPEPERAASPQPGEGWTGYPAEDAGWRAYAPEGEGCDPYEPPVVEGPVPDSIAETIGWFHTGRGWDEDLPDPMFGAQAIRVYDGVARLRDDLLAVAADIVPRSKVRRGDRCEPPSGPFEPGVCLVAKARDGGMMSACFTVQEIRSGDAILDLSEPRIVGLAPDGVEALAFEGGPTLGVSGNAFDGEVPRDWRERQRHFEP